MPATAPTRPLPLPGGRGRPRALRACCLPLGSPPREGRRRPWRPGGPETPLRRGSRLPVAQSPRVGRRGRAQCERMALGTSSALGAVCRGGRRRPGPAKVDDQGRRCREPGPSEGRSGRAAELVRGPRGGNPRRRRKEQGTPTALAPRLPLPPAPPPSSRAAVTDKGLCQARPCCQDPLVKNAGFCMFKTSYKSPSNEE